MNSFLILVAISVAGLLETVRASICVDEELQCAYNSKKICKKSKAYNGLKETTKNEESCVNWKKTVSPKHGNHSRCVATDGYGPWCYVDDFSIRWDYCFESCDEACVHKNEKCASNQELKCQHLGAYQGKKQQTKNGVACLPWKEANYTTMGEENYCRASQGWAPWCVVSGNGDWDLCFANCDERCLDNSEDCAHNLDDEACRRPGAYSGAKTTTVDGLDCIIWKESKKPGMGDNRRCFSTFGFGPWCYTDSKGSWGYCFPTCETDYKCVMSDERCAQNVKAVCKKRDSYNGERSQTVDAVPCLPWEQTNYTFLHDSSVWCRSTGGWAPWCRTSGKGDWGFCFQHCHEPGCINKARDCAYNDDSKCKRAGVYGGELNARTSTWKEVPCKNWLETTASNNGDNNRCQTTDGWGPWCYTGEDNAWDYCFRTCEPDDDSR